MRVCLTTQSRTHHQFPDQPYEGNPAALEPRTAWSAPSPSPYLRSNAVSPQWRSALEDGHQQPSPPLLHLCHCARPATTSTNNNYRGLSQEQDKWAHQRRQGDQLVLEHPKGLWHRLRRPDQATGRLPLRVEPRRPPSHLRLLAQAGLHPPAAGLRQHRPLLPSCQGGPHPSWGALQRHLLPVSLFGIFCLES